MTQKIATSKTAVILMAFALSSMATASQAEEPSRLCSQSTSQSADAIFKASLKELTQQELWTDPYWLRLVHYESNVFGGYTSEMKGDLFFMSEHGPTNPKAELEATLRGFYQCSADGERDPRHIRDARRGNDDTVGQSDTQHHAVEPDPATEFVLEGEMLGIRHPICRFPARLLWLTQKGIIKPRNLPKQKCPKLFEFFERSRAHSVTYVFSAYNLKVPASAFGHTMLRLNRRRLPAASKGSELLDLGIGFAASVDTDNPVAYMFKGLFGGFAGEYSARPYYYKVREYNDYESRDLWEYELSLTTDETLLLVAHIWEMSHGYSPYYYTEENCSYQLLRLLEVARPSLVLADPLGSIVLPADTVKAIAGAPNLVKNIRFRPSVRTQLMTRVATMSWDETDATLALNDDPNTDLSHLSPEQKVRVLDASVDLFDLYNGAELIMRPTKALMARRQSLLARRSLIRVPSEDLVIVPDSEHRPDLGHASKRFTILGGYDLDRGHAYEVGLRLAMHGLDEPSFGYPEHLQLEFVPTRVRFFPERNRLTLEEFNLVTVTSLRALDRFEPSMSWSFRAGMYSRQWDDCKQCLTGSTAFSGGITLSTQKKGFTWYLLGATELNIGSNLGYVHWLPVGAGFGPETGLRVRWSSHWNTLLSGRALYWPSHNTTLNWGSRLSTRGLINRHLAVGAMAEWSPYSKMSGLEVLIYY